MKIGIITFYAANNMGAICQAHALQQTICELFPESTCGVVDFEREKRLIPPTLPSVYRRKSGKSLKDKLKGLTHCALTLQAKWSSSGQAACQSFINDNLYTLQDTKISADGCLDTTAAEPPYDLLVAGSDQIWGKGFGMKPYLFCRTTGIQPKKVAYAPSMGPISHFNDRDKALLKERLADFSALSCRETDGAAFLKDLCGKECPLVLDPTLLLAPEEWRKLAKRPRNAPKGDFVFSYQVTWAKDCTRLARQAAKQLGLPLVILRSVNPYSYFTSCGPREFLWYISHAKQVVTSSFHGTALSLSLGTPFLSIRTKTPQTRITTLLHAAGCEDCYLAGDYTGELPLGLQHNGYANLAEQRQFSREYLTQAIRNAMLPTTSNN